MRDVIIATAFTRNGQGGNAAGIVLNADNLSDKEMQQIAAEVNLSETAFVQNSKLATKKVRFFTPKGEVDLCGHATIATWSTMASKGFIKSGEYTQELKAGILKVTIFDDGKVIMDQTLPKFGKVIDPEIVADILNIPVEWIKNTNLKPQIVSTGLYDLFVPIDNREHLFSIKSDIGKIIDFQKKENVGLHLFTLDSIDSNSVTNSRNMDPIHGIIEESATGSSHGAMMCYLFNKSILSKDQVRNGLIGEQGDSMGIPSEVFVKLDIDGDNRISRVRVGGYAIVENEY